MWGSCGSASARRCAPGRTTPRSAQTARSALRRPTAGGGTTDGGAPGFFSLRYTVPIWDPYTYGDPGPPMQAEDALDDLAFSSDGQLLFYSNCAEMFAADTQGAVLADLQTVDALIDASA